jgi:hypothetical protein
MTTVNLIPPSDGQHNSISVNGRTYASTPGISIPVPDFDAAVLQANGWAIQPTVPATNSTISTTTGGVAPAYYFQGIVNPPTPSTAIVHGILAEANYALGASAISGAGHLIGCLGHLINNNTNTLGLGIGIEGKIDNTNAGSIITTAISVDANLGSNAGVIGAWYGVYSDLGGNAGIIGNAAFYGCNIDSNPGTIGNVYGLNFPTLSAQTNITGALAGLFFNNNPAFAGAAKYVVFGADPGALIFNVGNIQTSAQLIGETFQLSTGAKTATAVAGAATLNKASGKITTEALTTAAGATYTLTLTNSQIAAADTAFVSIANGTNSAGDPAVGLVTPAAGSVTIKVVNRHASAALNGTLVISFASMKV